jgi:23S rRNA (pseudouridine1915-N3)-methyltransferase
MYKVKIYSVGKTKEPWLQEALLEYEKRLGKQATIEWILPKTSKELEEKLSDIPLWIALDVGGEKVDSIELSRRLLRWFEKGGSRLHFAIGGEEGWPPDLLAKSAWRWSLSPLTFTHQMSRLLLVEQLYRALEIARGSEYHKG